MVEWKIVCNDVIRWAAEYQGSPFAAILCDPPYGLEFMGKEWDRFQGYTTDIDFKGFTLPRQRKRNIKCPDCDKYIYDHEGRACTCGGVTRAQMRAYEQFCYDWIRAIIPHLLPGAFLFVFASSRGWHRLACALEDAGLIIQPSIFIWLNAQSFPKATRIDSQLDRRPNFQKIDGFRKRLDEIRLEKGYSIRQINEHFGMATTGSGMASHWLNHPTQPTIPTKEQYQELKSWWGLDDSLDSVYYEAEREIIGSDKARSERTWFTAEEWDITAPATDLARAWEGHRYGGQILKNCAEPIIVAQKPWVGKRLDCIVRTGAGSLWVDGGRVSARRGPDDNLTCQRFCDILTSKQGGQSWENEEVLCNLCAKGVDSKKRPITLATKESIAQSNVVPILNEKAEIDHDDTGKMDIGCFDGPSQAEQSGNQKPNTNLNIGESGKMPMDQYQTGILSITSTATDLITDLKTCSLCGSQIMSECTYGKVEQKNHNDDTEVSQKSSNGMLNGCDNTAQKSGRWPSNFALCHSEGCERVGVKRVKGSHIDQRVERSKSDSNSIGDQTDSYCKGYADPDGMETVENFRCTPECPARKLGEQSGELGNALRSKRHVGKQTEDSLFGKRQLAATYDDKGTAARYFFQADWSHEVAERIAGADPVRYQPKAAKRERNQNLDDFYWRKDKAAPIGFVRIDKDEWEALGEEEERIHEETGKRVSLRAEGNIHSTVKPINLCKHLATLLSPPKEYAPRRLLIPFSGTMSEGIGALLSGGFEEIVGIDSEQDYCDIAEARMKFWQAKMEKTGLSEPKAILKTCTKKVSPTKQKDDAKSRQDKLF